jgi:putative tricarboxylic transport membrane protein
VVGVIPGLGGSVVDWIAYGHTVQTTKNKENFSKGEIRGVIGPESSNNAKEGGGLVPTLLFGIPGSGSMAIFIGAVALLGSGDIEVGPAMIKNNLNYTYAIVWLLALANVLGTLLCIVVSGPIARLTTIRFALLAPFLFMLISFAAFQSGQNLGDLVALFAISLIGILLRRFDWSRPAFLIGFVLSNPAEAFTNQVHQVAKFKFGQGIDVGLAYIFSPIVIVLIVITVVSIVVGIRQAKHIMAEGDLQSKSKRAPMIFLLAVLAYLVISFWNASLISNRLLGDKIFPMFISAVAIVACLSCLVSMIRKPATDMLFADREVYGDDANARYGLWSTLAWFASLLVLTSLIGFILALCIFLFLFMRFRARLTVPMSALYTASGIVFMCFMAWLLHRDFPPGLLQEWFVLPWPLT